MLNRGLLALSLALLPAAAQAIPDRPEQLTFKPLHIPIPKAAAFKASLRNGIPVYIAEDPGGTPFVRLGVRFKGGTYLEPKGKEGLASLYGPLLREGGTRKTSPEALSERLEFLVANFSTGCSDVGGSLGIRLMEKDLDEGLDLFMQVLTQPAFAQDRVDLAKKDAVQFLEGLNDSAGVVAGYQMGFLLNGEGHFSVQRATAASLQSITREDLLAFHARMLHPENLMITVSGKFDRAAMLARLDGLLGDLKPGPAARVAPPVPPPVQQAEPGIYLVDKDVPQSVVSLHLPGLRRTDPDWHAALVMNRILGGGGFSSRLTKRVRSDEGLTYGISSGFSPGPYWRGDWNCGYQTRNRSVAYSLRLVKQEVERLKQDLVAEAELAETKEAIVSAFPAQWTNKDALVNHFAQERFTGWPEDWYQDFREKVRAVSAEDVRRMARKYLDLDRLVLVIVGRIAEVKAGDPKDHPGLLQDALPLPLKSLPLRDPLTLRALP